MTDNGWNSFLHSLAAAILVAVLVLVGVLCFVAWRTSKLIRDADNAAQNVNRTMIIVGAAATSVQKGFALEQAQEKAQLAQAGQAEAAFAASAGSLNSLVRHTDVSLNDPKTGLLPALAGVPTQVIPPLQTLERQAGDLLSDARVTNGQLGVAIQNFNTAEEQIDRTLPPLLISMQQTADNVDAISATSKDTSAQVDMTAKDFQAFVHRETTPARGTWHVIKGLLDSFAGPAANVATAIK